MNIQILLLIIIIYILLILWKEYDNLLKNLFEKNIIFQNKKRKSFLMFVNKFISLCIDGRLIFTPKLKPSHVKITALIPVFNASKSIRSTIRSIQNQNIEEIEIILVDDNSPDNTIKIVEKLQIEDQRIKIIKNQCNRGTLYSRSIGALISKGKYIMSIDNDDLFLYNIFKICYNESERNNIDIIEFSGFESLTTKLSPKAYENIPYYLRSKVNNLTIRQPKLSDLMYLNKNNTYKIIDAFIWGKCIKSFVYKRALKVIGKKFFNLYISYTEDRIVNFALLQVANSFKFIAVYGIFHYLHSSSIGHSWKNLYKNRISHDEILYILNIYNITKFSKRINIAACEMEKLHYKIVQGLNNKNKNLARYLFDKLIYSKYTQKFRKKKLISLYKFLFYS